MRLSILVACLVAIGGGPGTANPMHALFAGFSAPSALSNAHHFMFVHAGTSIHRNFTTCPLRLLLLYICIPALAVCWVSCFRESGGACWRVSVPTLSTLCWNDVAHTTADFVVSYFPSVHLQIPAWRLLDADSRCEHRPDGRPQPRPLLTVPSRH